MTGSVLRHRWFVMAIIFLARTTMAMQFQSVAPVAPLVVADLGITYAQLGLLIGLYLLPGTVLALPGGLLGQRFGNRRVALWGFALMALFGRDAPGVGATGASLRLLPNLSSREWALALTAGAAWMLFNVGFIVMVGFGPGLLQARGATLGQAGFLVSLAIWISTISVPLGGAVVDRTRRPNLAIVLSCLLTAGAFVLIPLTGPPVVWLFLSGGVVG